MITMKTTTIPQIIMAKIKMINCHKSDNERFEKRYTL